MPTVAFKGVGIPLMADIPVYGVMEKLQRSYPERCDELVDIMGIYINCRMYKLSYVQRRQTCSDYDWSDTSIQVAFIR